MKKILGKIKNFFSSTPQCKCMKGDDGKYYCFKKVQSGQWEQCSRPFDSEQECKDSTGEKCS